MSMASRARERARFERVHGVRLDPGVCIHRVRQGWFWQRSETPETLGEGLAFAFGSLAAFAFLSMRDLREVLQKK